MLKLHGSTNWRGLLFGGSTGYGAAHNSLGERSVLCFRQDFSYLGFPDVIDPHYGQLPSAASITAMITPNLKKRFFYETTFGKEWEPFWNTLWSQAKDALRLADEIVLIGYSMPAADERARELVFRSPDKNVRVTVCCHSATSGIAQEFRDQGFTNIHEPTNPIFEGWIAPNVAAQQALIREEARTVITTLRKQQGAGEELVKGTSWFFASIGYPNRPLRARERAQMQRRLNKVTEQLIPYDIALNALSGRISAPSAGCALLDGMLRIMFRAVNVDMTAEPDAIEAFQRQAAQFTSVSQELCAREGFSAIAADPLHEYDSCPVLSMYRRGLELQLKVIILGEGGNFLAARPDELSVHKSRSVSWLAQFVSQIISTLEWENEFKCDGIKNLAEFKTFVAEVNSIDPGFHAFRYPADFNVREFAARMDPLLDLLESTADGLAATWDIQMGDAAPDTESDGGNGEFNPTIH